MDANGREFLTEGNEVVDDGVADAFKILDEKAK
jgi:hypothetical protein